MQDKKTVIYIDAANIVLSCKNVDLKIDILKLVQKLKDKFRSDKVIYFTGNFRSMELYFEELKKQNNEKGSIFRSLNNEKRPMST